MIKNTILLFFIGLIFISNAQTGEVKGIIKNKETGESLTGISVDIYKLSHFVVSDIEGYYRIGNLKEGNYTLVFSSVSFDTVYKTVNIKAGKSKRLNVELNQRVNTIKKTIVKGKRRKKNKITDPIDRIGGFSIGKKDISRIPSVGGLPDLVQYLSVLPGIVSSGDQGGQLYIRGGSPVMNKVLLDGMTIYNPFHSIGLFSVFDAETIKEANVYSAAFGAEYGGRISAVMDIKTRDGSLSRTKGKISVGPFAATALLHGPLKKYKPGRNASSYMISYKNSYLNKSSKIVYPYLDQSKLPYSFQDLYGKVSLMTSSGSNIRLFGMHFQDKVDFPGSTKYNWLTTGFGARFFIVPEMSKTKITGNFAYSDYNISQREINSRERSSGINGFDIGLNFSNIIKRDLLDFGLTINGGRTDFVFFNANNRKVHEFQNTSEIGFYSNYRIKRKKYILNFGMRAQYYASLGNFSPEPRFKALVKLFPNLRLTAAGGLYSQNIISAISDRDVVNLFYGFLNGPDNLPSTFKNTEITHRLQKAIHGLTGLEYDINNNLTISSESYVKNFTQLTNINRDKLFEDIPANKDKDPRIRTDYIIEEGLAYGIDFTVKVDKGDFYFWAVYSHGYVTRTDEYQTYFTHYDRRNNVNLMLSYKFGKNKNSKLGMRWNYGTGFPFTPTQGFYEKHSFDDNLSVDPNKNNGQLELDYGELNSKRMPQYHRLDLSFTQKIKLAKRQKLIVNISVTNVYNRANIFYFNRSINKRVNQLPILPSASLSYYF